MSCADATHFSINALVVSWDVTGSILDLVRQPGYAGETVIGRIRAFAADQGRVGQAVHLLLQS